MNKILETIKTPNSILTWAVMQLLICGIVAHGVVAYLLYKEFYLGKKAIMVGSLDGFETQAEEGATFKRKK